MKTPITPNEVIAKMLDPNTTGPEVLSWWNFAVHNESFVFEIHPYVKDRIVALHKENPLLFNMKHPELPHILETYEHAMEK